MAIARQFISFAGQRIQQNPSIAAGSCIFMVAFTLVAANALVGQSGGHPDPIWATRDKVTTRSVPDTSQGERRGNGIARLIGIPEQVPVPKRRPDPAAEAAAMTVKDAQRELARLGYYDGDLDGIYGPRTRDAIIEFQREYGLAESGAVDPLLSDALEAAVDLRNRDDQVMQAIPASVDSTEIASVVEPATDSSPVTDSSDVRSTALVARIQIGLTNFGETGIAIDGTVDARTEAAIRNFQERYGLQADGQPSEQVMLKLEDIGALRAR